MPFCQLKDVTLHYRVDGQAHLPCLVLAHALGADLEMWQPQVPELSRHFHLLRFDARGHGRSTIPQASSDGYQLQQLGQDVIGLLDSLGIPTASYCGLSMGGITGLWLALHFPQRWNKMALCNTGAKIADEATWQARMDDVRRNGIGALASATLSRWFLPAFQATHASTVEDVRNTLLGTSAMGYRQCCAALRDADLRSQLGNVAVPTLVITGLHDPSTPPELGRQMAAAILGAQLTELESAHLSNISHAAAFNQAVLSFLRA
jgi:3-oxoadipate enol-lactonase